MTTLHEEENTYLDRWKGIREYLSGPATDWSFSPVYQLAGQLYSSNQPMIMARHKGMTIDSPLSKDIKKGAC